jgi:hypothetical protein
MTAFPYVGQKVRASELKPVHAFLRQTAAQSMPQAWTAVNFDTEDVDSHDGHSTSVDTSRYTAVIAGWYAVTGHGSFVTNNTGHRGVRVAKNGTVVPGSATYLQTTTGDVWAAASIPCQVSLAVGDYVTVEVIQDSGGNLNSGGATTDIQPSMSVVLIART